MIDSEDHRLTLVKLPMLSICPRMADGASPVLSY